MKRCVECSLVLPFDLFLGHNPTCNLCLVSPRNRKPDPPAGEWRELNMIARINDIYMRTPKPQKKFNYYVFEDGCRDDE